MPPDPHNLGSLPHTSEVFQELQLTDHDLVVIDEIVGGRYDALKDLLENSGKDMPNRDLLRADIAALEPTVQRIRATRLAR